MSLSRLFQAAAETVLGPKENPERSAPTATTIGAMRSEPAVAGPLAEKLAMFSSTFEESDVCTSWKWLPTETRFLAVAGGATWSGLGKFGSLSSAVPSNRSG